MRSKQRVVRLNEAGLRRLVREMMNGMGAGMTRDEALDRAEQLNSEYVRALNSYGDGMVDQDAMMAEFGPQLKAEAEMLLPMLGDGNGTATVVHGYDDELELQVRYTQGGKPMRVSGDLETIIARIQWPA